MPEVYWSPVGKRRLSVFMDHIGVAWLGRRGERVGLVETRSRCLVGRAPGNRGTGARCEFLLEQSSKSEMGSWLADV